jgi:2'-5' RNA ligase
MRLFTAVDPSEEVLERLTGMLERLRPAARLRWSRPESLHLTLKFLGEYPEAELGALEAVLKRTPWPGAFDIRVRGLGFFPDERAPRVFWAGVEAGPELARLAEALDEALVEVGIPRERRPYKPHLTLARIQDRVPLQRLREAIQGLDPVDFGSFRAERFYLYRSQPGPGGSVYTRMGSFGTTF